MTARTRRPPARRGVSPGLVVLIAALTLAAGLAVGYAARGDRAPEPATSEVRGISVITVTVPATDTGPQGGDGG